MIIHQCFNHIIAYYTDDFKCAREEGNNSTCSFSDVTESYYFYSDLNTYAQSHTDLGSITNIYFKNSKLNNIPKELTIHFPNIVWLDASNIRLSRLEKQDFVGSCKIKFLNASFNKIHEITKDINHISGMRDLNNLDLSHNIIDRIEDNAFHYRETFLYLNLSNNRIGKISSNFLKSLKGLEILRLDNNRITEITGNIDDISMNLKELYLQNNNLKIFYPSIIPTATYLDLSFNDLQDDLDVSATKLEELYVKSNLLPSIKLNAELEILDASDNENQNFIFKLNFKSGLKKLSLSNLDVSSMKNIFAEIKNCYNLMLLDISKNNLGTFNFGDFYLPSLETLNLRHCSMYSIINWDKVTTAFKRIKSIDIRGNYLHCDFMEDFVSKYSKSVTIEGLKDVSEKDFVSKNCASDYHKHKEAEHDSTKVEANILWFLVIFFLLGYIVGGLYFANKRFYLIQKVKERVTARGSFHNEIDTSQFNHA